MYFYIPKRTGSALTQHPSIQRFPSEAETTEMVEDNIVVESMRLGYGVEFRAGWLPNKVILTMLRALVALVAHRDQ